MSQRDHVAIRLQLAAWSIVLLLTLTGTKLLKLWGAALRASYYLGWLVAAAVAVGISAWVAYRLWGRRGLKVSAVVFGAGVASMLWLRPKPILTAIHVTRADLAFVLALFLVLAGLRGLVGHRWPGVVRLVAAVVYLPLIALASLELGLFATTGSEAGWYELSFVLGNASAVTSLIGETLGPGALLFALPLLAAVGILVFASPLAERTSASPWVVRPPATLRTAMVAAGLVPLAFLAPAPDIESTLLIRTAGNSFVELLTSTPDVDALDVDRESLQRYAPGTLRIERPVGDVSNLLYVILESTRADYTTPYSSGLGTTPFMARLAGRGLVIENLYAVVPFSSKVISSLFCATYPRIGMALAFATDGPQRSDGCLPKALADIGFRTAAFTTWCGADESCQGWTDISGFEARLTAVGFQAVVAQEDLEDRGLPRVYPGGVPEEGLLEPIGRWLASLGPTEPFAMAVWTSSTHAPFVAPDGFRGWPVQREGNRPPDPVANPFGVEVDDYYRSLQYVDAFLARLADTLEAADRLQSTLIVVVGDHGVAFGEHGLHYYERVLYEEGIRVPAILAGPGVPVGRVETPAQHIDLVPTIVDALGLRPAAATPAMPDAISLLGPPEGPRTLYFSCFTEGRCMALRRGDLKYVYNYRYRPMEVYDLAEDPGETRNLAEDVAPDVLGSVERELLRWRRSVNRFYDVAASDASSGPESESGG